MGSMNKYPKGYTWSKKGLSFTVVEPYISKKTGKQDGYLVACSECGTEFKVNTKSVRDQLASRCPTCNVPKIGSYYGKWEIVGNTELRECECGGKTRYTLCRCSCIKSELRWVLTAELRRGKSKSCGCKIKDSIKEKHDIVGNAYGRLLVLMYLNKNFSGPARYLCYCDPELGGCGNTIEVLAAALKSGHTASCGCLAQEWLGRSMFGDNNPNYKGGRIALNLSLRKSKRYLDLRELVFKRDNYICQYSGEQCVDLVVHHKKPLAFILSELEVETIEEAYKCAEVWDASNLITLARKWHDCGHTNESNSFHNLYGVFECTKDDFEEWFDTRTYGKDVK